MSNKDLEYKIKSEFSTQTPDNFDSIKERVQLDKLNTRDDYETLIDSKPKLGKRFKHKLATALSLCFVLVFSIGIISGYLIPKNQASDPAPKEVATVYIDVNPSIAITVNEEGRISSFSAINDDAVAILDDLNLVGTELYTGINTVIGKLHITGYISKDDNAILVSVDTDKLDVKEEVLSSVVQEINTTFSRSSIECFVVAQGVEEAINKELAEGYGVSLGKMSLVNRIINGAEKIYQDGTIPSVEELVSMSVEELILMYNDVLSNTETNGTADVILSGKPSGYLTKADAEEIAFNYLNITREQAKILISYISVDTVLDKSVLTYTVTFTTDSQILNLEYNKFVISATDGEILSYDTVAFLVQP